VGNKLKLQVICLCNLVEQNNDEPLPTDILEEPIFEPIHSVVQTEITGNLFM
jgi:hypothetical protein